MANSQKDTRKRLLQKSQALRMLLTSGVIRSADVYPLDTKYTGLRTNPSHTFAPEKLIYRKPIHAADHKHHMTLLAEWQTTFVDILREFGKR